MASVRICPPHTVYSDEMSDVDPSELIGTSVRNNSGSRKDRIPPLASSTEIARRNPVGMTIFPLNVVTGARLMRLNGHSDSPHTACILRLSHAFTELRRPSPKR